MKCHTGAACLSLFARHGQPIRSEAIERLIKWTVNEPARRGETGRNSYIGRQWNSAPFFHSGGKFQNFGNEKPTTWQRREVVKKKSKKVAMIWLQYIV